MKSEFFRNKYVKLAMALLCFLLVMYAVFYVFLPPLNFYSKGFWAYMIFGVLLLTTMLGLFLYRDVFVQVNQAKSGKTSYKLLFQKTLTGKILLAVAGGLLVILLLGMLLSSTLFNARRYAGVIEVSSRDFATDMPKTDEVTNIALLDTQSAAILGTRKLGELSEVVSQFVVSQNYRQVNYRSIPKKVATLEYDGFFKWINNKENGVPGYIMVDAVDNYAEYVALPADQAEQLVADIRALGLPGAIVGEMTEPGEKESYVTNLNK